MVARFHMALLAAILASRSVSGMEVENFQIASDGHVQPVAPQGPGYVRREQRVEEAQEFFEQEVEVAVTSTAAPGTTPSRDSQLDKAVEDAKAAVRTMTRNNGVEADDDAINTWKDEERQASSAMSEALMASMMFIVFVFYLTNSSKDWIKISAWRVVVRSIALFSVVLFFMAMKKAWKLVFGESSGSHLLSDIWSSVRFLILLFLVPYLIKTRVASGTSLNEKKTVCLRMTGTFAIAYAGADAFTDILKTEVFYFGAHNHLPYLAGVVLMTLTLLILTIIATVLREWYFAPSDPGASEAATAPLADGASPPPTATEGGDAAAAASGQSDEMRELLDVIETMEIEVTGFIVGFMISMWLRFQVSGVVPGAGTGVRIEESDVFVMATYTAVSALLALLVANLILPMAYWPSVATGWCGRISQRILRTFAEVVVMTATWIAFYFLQWVAWQQTAREDGAHHASKLVATNNVALVATFLAFVPFSVLGLAGRRNLMMSTLLLNSATLMLGFSWETAVYTVIQGSASSRECGATVTQDCISKESKLIIAIFLIFLTIASIAPAWYLYMLPDSLQVPMEKEEATDKTPAGETGEAGEGAAATPATPAPPAPPAVSQAQEDEGTDF